ncbi:alpha/beta fold hydrolase [Sulfitobacter sp. F26204]|uniref:alpha/beta fold hydrolase n=1 Tax=Sulfitobacter sp. F26204 TaxID=2996014 RepID=UPI00225E0980|nr:alpha/beta fold hydrolase [Sulfitobacter sp. F26204]MCX7561351.1 alpha/beta fold hydrolase [Sulfitobacter sp. F26204]
MSGSEHVQVDGASLYFEVESAHSGAPWLVFCNSLLTDHTVWDGQVAAFKDRYNILRYDQRGHGRSSDPDGPMSFDVLGSDAIATMEACDIPTATFIGLSMGTPTALDIWGKRPDLISRLVLCDGQSRPTQQGIGLWSERVQEARTIGLDAYCRATLGRWFGSQFLEKQPEQAQVILSMMMRTRFAGFENCVRALQNFDYADLLPSITVPTQILVGANDGGLPIVMQQMCENIPAAKLTEIAGAGHIPNVEQAAAFNKALGDFLSKTT